jgi:adenine/guanine phosphoribosyltransferase-like PRPP-binding protein
MQRELTAYYDRIIPSREMPDASAPAAPVGEGYALRLPDGDWVALPLLALPPDEQTAILSLCISANSFELERRLSNAMAELARPLMPDVVLGMPTLGMVLAASVAQRLGHPYYAPLSYSRKFWFDESLSIAVNSITTPSQQKKVYLDPRIVDRLAGKRVVIVDDVISTGTTLAAQIQLLARVGGKLVGIVSAMKESRIWIDRLRAIDPSLPGLVRSCLRCPLFRRVSGEWTPDWSTLPE